MAQGNLDVVDHGSTPLMQAPRVAVLGTGANGATIAADLTRAGVDVVLIDQWPAHVEAMRERGVKQVLPDETIVTQVRAFHLCDVCTFTSKFDVVLLSCKAYDTRWHAQLIEPYLADHGLIAGVQNGMTADVLVEVAGPRRAIGSVIEISSMMFEPGVVHRHSPPSRSWFAVGALDSSAKAREIEVARLLRHVGTCEIVDDIQATKWMKLVSNATVLVTTAILGLPMLEAVRITAMRDFMIRCGQEALDAGLTQGYDVLPIFGLKPRDMLDRETLVEKLLDTLMDGFVLPGSITTVLQDWMKSRRSEAGNLNGLVVEVLGKLGRAAPANAAVVELAGRIERHEIEPGTQHLGTLLALSSR